MFMSLIQKRRSIRKFLDRPVEAEKIDLLLEADLRAPSSKGLNPWEFIVLTDRSLLERLSQAKEQRDWQMPAAIVYKMIKEKKQDFLIVDVRPVPPGQHGGKIEGSIPIPYYDIMKPENLEKLPKDKKLILVCVTGQTQNLPIVPLRVLGYEAYTMAFGMTAWIKGYFGGNFMKAAIDRANYPVVQ